MALAERGEGGARRENETAEMLARDEDILKAAEVSSGPRPAR
jgi:hypothetical protein